MCLYYKKIKDLTFQIPTKAINKLKAYLLILTDYLQAQERNKPSYFLLKNVRIYKPRKQKPPLISRSSYAISHSQIWNASCLANKAKTGDKIATTGIYLDNG